MSLGNDIFSGARARLYLNGVLVGHMTEVSGRLTLQQLPLEECGSPIAQAIVTVGSQVELSCAFVRLVTKDAAGQLLPKMNDADMLDWEEMTAVVHDLKTDKPMYQVGGVKPTTFNFQVTARGMVGQNMTWIGRTMQQTSEVA